LWSPAVTRGDVRMTRDTPGKVKFEAWAWETSGSFPPLSRVARAYGTTRPKPEIRQNSGVLFCLARPAGPGERESGGREPGETWEASEFENVVGEFENAVGDDESDLMNNTESFSS
jgi:hypothetical protein